MADGRDDQNPETPTPPTPDEGKPEGTKPKKVVFDPEQQEALNAIVVRESEKAVEKALLEANEKADADKKKAMKAALKEQEKFEELAGNLQAEVDDLKADNDRLRSELQRLKAHADKYAETVEKDYETFVESMPSALRPFEPGPDATIEEKRSFIEKARDAQTNLGEPYRPGLPPSPQPTRPASDHSGFERELGDKLADPMYSRLSG